MCICCIPNSQPSWNIFNSTPPPSPPVVCYLWLCSWGCDLELPASINRTVPTKKNHQIYPKKNTTSLKTYKKNYLTTQKIIHIILQHPLNSFNFSFADHRIFFLSSPVLYVEKNLIIVFFFLNRVCEQHLFYFTNTCV